MGPLDLDTAYSLLGFAHDQLPTESEISSSFRARIRNHHPDKGFGEEGEQMAALLTSARTLCLSAARAYGRGDDTRMEEIGTKQGLAAPSALNGTKGWGLAISDENEYEVQPGGGSSWSIASHRRERGLPVEQRKATDNADALKQQALRLAEGANAHQQHQEHVRQMADAFSVFSSIPSSANSATARASAHVMDVESSRKLRLRVSCGSGCRAADGLVAREARTRPPLEHSASAGACADQSADPAESCLKPQKPPPVAPRTPQREGSSVGDGEKHGDGTWASRDGACGGGLYGLEAVSPEHHARKPTKPSGEGWIHPDCYGAGRSAMGGDTSAERETPVSEGDAEESPRMLALRLALAERGAEVSRLQMQLVAMKEANSAEATARTRAAERAEAESRARGQAEAEVRRLESDNAALRAALMKMGETLSALSHSVREAATDTAVSSKC